MSIEDVKARRRQISVKMDAALENMGIVAQESERVADVLRDADVILNDLDNEFERRTGLTSVDVAFLFTAIGLQIARQYLVTNFKERLDDKEAADEVKKKKKESSERISEKYNPSFIEVKNNPVPYDAIYGGKNFNLNMGGKNHRIMTLGHDPVLGWIFGTANIATGTLTTWQFKTYHVRTGFTVDGKKRDKITEEASTAEMLTHVFNKMQCKEGKWDALPNIEYCNANNKIVGPVILALSILKQAEHLRSDVKSKESLPLPIISTISPELAQKLANYGLDMANIITVAKQASYAALINMIIAMVHRLFYDGTTEEDEKLYEVRTRKILSYSNAVAASSNIAVVALTRKFDLLDIGGIGVAIYRLITDTKFKYEVKKEFVFGHFNKMIEGDELKLKSIEEER